MTWFDWVLVALFASSALVNVAIVDKPREPITPQAATFIVLVNGLVVAGILAGWR